MNNFIKDTIHEVVVRPDQDPFTVIQRSVAGRIPKSEQSEVQALIIDELRRLHEGVLARCGLRPSEFASWKAVQRR